MLANLKSYQLKQGEKNYILTTSLVINSIRVTCKDANGQIYTRDFTVQDLRTLNKIFEIIKTPLQALQLFDKALKVQKVSVEHQDGFVKIIFFIKSNGIMNRVEIPLGKVSPEILSSMKKFISKNGEFTPLPFDPSQILGKINAIENTSLDNLQNINNVNLVPNGLNFELKNGNIISEFDNTKLLGKQKITTTTNTSNISSNFIPSTSEQIHNLKEYIPPNTIGTTSNLNEYITTTGGTTLETTNDTLKQYIPTTTNVQTSTIPTTNSALRDITSTNAQSGTFPFTAKTSSLNQYIPINNTPTATSPLNQYIPSKTKSTITSSLNQNIPTSTTTSNILNQYIPTKVPKTTTSILDQYIPTQTTPTTTSTKNTTTNALNQYIPTRNIPTTTSALNQYIPTKTTQSTNSKLNQYIPTSQIPTTTTSSALDQNIPIKTTTMTTTTIPTTTATSSLNQFIPTNEIPTTTTTSALDQYISTTKIPSSTTIPITTTTANSALNEYIPTTTKTTDYESKTTATFDNPIISQLPQTQIQAQTQSYGNKYNPAQLSMQDIVPNNLSQIIQGSTTSTSMDKIPNLLQSASTSTANEKSLPSQYFSPKNINQGQTEFTQKQTHISLSSNSPQDTNANDNVLINDINKYQTGNENQNIYDFNQKIQTSPLPVTTIPTVQSTETTNSQYGMPSTIYPIMKKEISKTPLPTTTIPFGQNTDNQNTQNTQSNGYDIEHLLKMQKSQSKQSDLFKPLYGQNISDQQEIIRSRSYDPRTQIVNQPKPMVRPSVPKPTYDPQLSSANLLSPQTQSKIQKSLLLSPNVQRANIPKENLLLSSKGTQVSQLFQIPQTSQIPQVSQAHQMTQTSHYKKDQSLQAPFALPKASQYSQTYQLQETTQVPQTSQLPKASQYSQTYQLQETTQVPQTSQLPKASQYSQTYQLQETSQVPQTSQYSQTLQQPQVLTSQVPQVARFTQTSKQYSSESQIPQLQQISKIPDANINIPSQGKIMMPIKTTIQDYKSPVTLSLPRTHDQEQEREKEQINQDQEQNYELNPVPSLPQTLSFEQNLLKNEQSQISPENQNLSNQISRVENLQKSTQTIEDYLYNRRPNLNEMEDNYDQYQTTTTKTRKSTQNQIVRGSPQPQSLLQPQQQILSPLQQSIIPNYNDDRIRKLLGDTDSLKNQHHFLKEKLDELTGKINSYKNKINELENEKKINEVNEIKAENESIRQQLLELSKLKDTSEEVKMLRNQLKELDPLRKKAAEMEILKGQLNDLNDLREKVEELDEVKQQLSEIEDLKMQLSQMSDIEEQLGELSTLRIQAADAENLRRKIEKMETEKVQYEQEIQSLRNTQRLSDIRNTGGISNITKSNILSPGMESKQLLFEEKQQSQYIKGDIIHNMNELEMITRKINKLNKKIILNLLYKATADSDKASAFHERCDDANSTLVLVETDKGKRFGGFTTCSWRGDCIDKKDEDAFVFSLDKMMVYENIPGEDAVGCYPKFGPIFLGCQIRIYDNAFSKGGTTFEKGLNYNTEEDYELTDGDREFGVKEIEVYEVIAQ